MSVPVVSAQWPDDPLRDSYTLDVPLGDLPIGGLGLAVEACPDDEALVCSAAFYGPNLIEMDGSWPNTFCGKNPSLWNRVLLDHRNYYDARSFRLIASGFLVGATIANTQLDQELHDHFQTSVRSATSDDWSEFLHADKDLGDGKYTLPIFATAWAAGAVFDESRLFVTTGAWGERSLRTFLVGAPPLMLAQRLTGGSRPNEKNRNSRWLPIQDNNGVSGHAFMASLPFINAAKMTDNPWLKTTYYAGSLFGPLSRVNDGAHYPSQVALGWWMAFIAATAVDRTQLGDGHVQFYPFIANDDYGGMFEFRF